MCVCVCVYHTHLHAHVSIYVCLCIYTNTRMFHVSKHMYWIQFPWGYYVANIFSHSYNLSFYSPVTFRLTEILILI